MPCRIDITMNVTSSRNEYCIRGVRLLRAEEFEGAYSNFIDALAQNPNDHRAAYGAGLACEASGRLDEALKYYKQACAGQENATYRDARDRMKAYADRARG
jgi:Flp pilus assembly protein TadD